MARITGNHGHLLRKITAAGLAALLLVASLPPPAAAQSCQGWNTEKFFETATLDQVKACLSAGQNLNERDAHGLAALHRAARQTSDPAVIEALLDAGANPRASSLDGRKPWDFGRRNKKIKGSDAYQRLMIAVDSLKKVSARRADWSRVQAVAYDTKIAVRLYKDAAPRGQRRFNGHLVSATDGSISIVLEDGQTRTFLKSNVHRVQTPLPFIQRGAGWAALGISGAITGVLLLAAGTEGAEPGEVPAFIGLVVGIPTLVGFLAGKMGPIYDVPANHRIRPQADQQSGDQDDASGKQEEPRPD